MKIIQSFWSGNNDCLKDGYGWLSPIYHYASWILSCNQLHKYYDDVILVTDRVGYDVLIDKLHLPYADVIVCLDELSKYNPNLWALAKIKAYFRKFLLVSYGIFRKISYLCTKLSVLCILQNTETSRSPLVSILLPILYRQTPNFLIFNQRPI